MLINVNIKLFSISQLAVFLFFLLSSVDSCAQYEGPIPPITSGYGSEGSHQVGVINIENDYFVEKDISVFYPENTPTPVPTIYFLHGWGGVDTLYYIETIRNLASSGYAIVYVPYRSFGVTNSQRYRAMYDGFVKATESLPTIIDASRIGFYGHSLGGGAVPSISYRLFTEKGWGSNGKFIFSEAPYYSFEISQNQLENYPSDCNMLLTLFDDDTINDHRMGIDIFNQINISADKKDCLFVRSDTVSGYIYEASHSLNVQYTNRSEFNALDYYVTFRLLQALADYTFTGNLVAKDIALGNGSINQVNMGEFLSPLIASDLPSPQFSESFYTYQCSDVLNPRIAYCNNVTSIEDDLLKEHIIIYPNPTKRFLTIESETLIGDVQISVYSMVGKQIASFNKQKHLDLEELKNGVFLLIIKTKSKEVRRLIVKE